MNTQYALIQHLLKDPNKLTKLSQSGFKGSYFKDETYAALYELIFENYSKYSSVPTSDELRKFDITLEDEIPHTFEHCLALVVEDARKREFSKIIRKAADELIGTGPDAAEAE